MTKMYDPREDIDEKGVKRHRLFSTEMWVTWEQHFDYLSSPKKMDAAGLNFFEERTRYENEHEWFGFPQPPKIDPNEELWA